MPKKFLGADYGFSVIFPFVNNRFAANILPATGSAGGLSDMFVAPLYLGWHKKKADYLLTYGFYAPTGAYSTDTAFNPGLGFWENQIEAGLTYNIDAKKLWNVAAMSTWEINASKLGQDIKPGPMMNLEYGLGHRFDKYMMNAGAAGYYYQKLSADSGSGVAPLTQGLLDRSFGIGPEWKWTNLKAHLAFDVRYEPQFGVRSKTSGNVLVFSLTYLKFFPPAKP